MARYGFWSDEGVLSAERGGKDPRSACEARPSQKLDGMPGSAAAQDEELELIRAVAAGDHHGFETLYCRYAPRLGRYLFRLLKQREAVEEAINDVMLVVWRSAQRFQATSRLSTWLWASRTTRRSRRSRVPRAARGK